MQRIALDKTQLNIWKGLIDVELEEVVQLIGQQGQTKRPRVTDKDSDRESLPEPLSYFSSENNEDVDRDGDNTDCTIKEKTASVYPGQRYDTADAAPSSQKRPRVCFNKLYECSVAAEATSRAEEEHSVHDIKYCDTTDVTIEEDSWDADGDDSNVIIVSLPHRGGRGGVGDSADSPFDLRQHFPKCFIHPDTPPLKFEKNLGCSVPLPFMEKDSDVRHLNVEQAEVHEGRTRTDFEIATDRAVLTAPAATDTHTDVGIILQEDVGNDEEISLTEEDVSILEIAVAVAAAVAASETAKTITAMARTLTEAARNKEEEVAKICSPRLLKLLREIMSSYQVEDSV